MSDVSNAIYQAIDLFKGGDAWGQGHDAVDKNGTPVAIDSEDAVRFCLRGAVAKVCSMSGCTCILCRMPEFALVSKEAHRRKGIGLFSLAMEKMNTYTNKECSMDPVMYNDRHSYEDVVLMMKHVASAIE